MHRLFVCLCLLSAATAQEWHVITAIAQDRSTGKAVGGLTVNDLEIVQDSRSYSVDSLRGTDGPKNIMLVVDGDSPMAAQSLTPGIRIAEYEFGPGDRAGMVAAGRKPKLEVPLTNDVRSVLRRLDDVTRTRRLLTSKQHALYDSILIGIQNLPERDRDRNSHIVVLAALPDLGSKATAAEVVAAAARRRAVIDGIVFAPKYLAQEARDRLGLDPVATDDDLRKVCSPTGGTSRIEEPSGYLLRQAIMRIRNRFQVTGSTRGNGPVSLRLTTQGRIKHPDLELLVLLDELNPVPASADSGEKR